MFAKNWTLIEFIENNFSLLENWVFFAIKSIDFDRELLRVLRPPTEMVLYFLESLGHYFSIEYRLISVGHL